jgi:tetratricopeptide (TPR) repeat protein
MPKSWTDPWVLATIGLMILICLALVLLKKRSPLAFFFLVWFAVFWLPTSNLWPLTNRMVADRYLYTTLVGFSVLVALLINKIFKHTALKYAIVLIFLVGLSILTWKQNYVWKSPMSLWSHAVKINPKSSPALNNLGKVYYERKQYTKAIYYFRASARMNPHNASPLFNLGLTHEKMGHHRIALEYFIAFLGIDSPRYHTLSRSLKVYLKSEYGLTVTQKKDIKELTSNGRKTMADDDPAIDIQEDT